MMLRWAVHTFPDGDRKRVLQELVRWTEDGQECEEWRDVPEFFVPYYPSPR